jgi:hypothetical protein
MDKVYTKAFVIASITDSDYFKVCDWLNDDDGIGKKAAEMTTDELVTAWIERGCTFEYSKEN